MTRAELFAWAEALVESRGGSLIPPIRRDLGDRDPELVLSQLSVQFDETMRGYEDNNEGTVHPHRHGAIQPASFDDEPGNIRRD